MTTAAPFPTIVDAIRWATDRWGYQRTVPVRLHVRDEEGVGLIHERPACGCLACTDGPSERGLGSHAFSRHFSQTLDGTSNVVWSAPTTIDCHHPLLSFGMSPRNCPECWGLGMKESRVDRFRFPMSRALERLAERRPKSVHILVTLATQSWSVPATVNALELADERPIFAAIRALHQKYEEGPYGSSSTAGSGHVVEVKWTELSDSQRNAMESTTSA